jgi:hypothetical protein
VCVPFAATLGSLEVLRPPSCKIDGANRPLLFAEHNSQVPFVLDHRGSRSAEIERLPSAHVVRVPHDSPLIISIARLDLSANRRGSNCQREAR